MAATAIVLDLDGTLWDSYPLFAAVLAAEAGACEAEIKFRLSNGESIVTLAKNLGISRSRFTERSVLLATHSFLYKGALEALEVLHAKGVLLGVFTSLPGWIAVPLIQAVQLQHYFVDVAHAGVAPRKPNPMGILRVLEAMGRRPSYEVFYVGDQSRDSLTAERANVSFAWAAYGYCGETPRYANVVLDSPGQLIQL